MVCNIHTVSIWNMYLIVINNKFALQQTANLNTNLLWVKNSPNSLIKLPGESGENL